MASCGSTGSGSPSSSRDIPTPASAGICSRRSPLMPLRRAPPTNIASLDRRRINNAGQRRDRTTGALISEEAGYDSDPERYYLEIELLNDCTLTLSLPKTASDPPHVYVSCQGGGDTFDYLPLEWFRQWVEVALGKRDHMRWLDCACCGRDERGPMLPDDVWNRLADPGERILCIDCMQKRAQERLGQSLARACRACRA